MKAFICDIERKPCEGEAKKSIEVVGKKFKLVLAIYRKADAGTFVEADLGPEAVAKIAAGLASIVNVDK